MRPTAGTVKTIGGWKSSVEWTRQCKGRAGEKGWGSRRGQATAAAPKKINLHAWGAKKNRALGRRRGDRGVACSRRPPPALAMTQQGHQQVKEHAGCWARHAAPRAQHAACQPAAGCARRPPEAAQSATACPTLPSSPLPLSSRLPNLGTPVTSDTGLLMGGLPSGLSEPGGEGCGMAGTPVVTSIGGAVLAAAAAAAAALTAAARASAGLRSRPPALVGLLP